MGELIGFTPKNRIKEGEPAEDSTSDHDTARVVNLASERRRIVEKAIKEVSGEVEQLINVQRWLNSLPGASLGPVKESRLIMEVTATVNTYNYDECRKLISDATEQTVNARPEFYAAVIERMKALADERK